MTLNKQKIKFLAGIALFSGLMVPALSANAQLINDSWGFNQQNRASIAALIRQVENENNNASVVATGAGDIASLVCGSDGQASAQGNSSCIILNNSTGSVYVGQDSEGDQTADSDVTETTNVEETINGADEILDTLSGDS